MENEHSRLGIASFALSVAVVILIFLIFVAAGMLHARHPQGPYPGQTFIGLSVIFLLFVDFIAIGLGIGAICQNGQKKIFGILGLSFSLLTIMGTVMLIIIGLAVAHKF